MDNLFTSTKKVSAPAIPSSAKRPRSEQWWAKWRLSTFDLTLGGGGHGVQGQIYDILRPQLAMNRFLPLLATDSHSTYLQVSMPTSGSESASPSSRWRNLSQPGSSGTIQPHDWKAAKDQFDDRSSDDRRGWRLQRGGNNNGLTTPVVVAAAAAYNKYWSRTARKISFMYSFSGNCAAQSQFPHSCGCEQFIYSQDRSTYFPAAE